MNSIQNRSENIGEAVKVLKKGGVIAHPADTCFGLAGDLYNEAALKKLQAIKGRDNAKPMSIMLPAFLKPRLCDYAVCDDFSEMVCENLLPGPVTIVLPKGPKIPSYFFPDQGKVGIRMPLDILTEDLLTKFKGPLITTSANLTGEPVCCTYDEVKEKFEGAKNKPDLFLRGAIRGHCMPSTVILVENGVVRILREGPLKKKQLEALLGIEVQT